MTAAFEFDHVTRIFDNARLVPPYEIAENTVFVAVDQVSPGNTGEALWQTTIVSYFVSAQKLVVTGLELVHTHSRPAGHTVLYKHIDALREQPCFSDCRFVLLLESNYGNEAQLLAARMLRTSELPANKLAVLCEFAHAYGVFTTPGRLDAHFEALKDKVVTNYVFMHDALVCIDPFSEQTPEETKATTLRAFERQFYALRVDEYNPAAGGFGKLYTGAIEVGAQSTRVAIDLVFLLLSTYGIAARFLASPSSMGLRTAESLIVDPFDLGDEVESPAAPAAPAAPVSVAH